MPRGYLCWQSDVHLGCQKRFRLFVFFHSHEVDDCKYPGELWHNTLRWALRKNPETSVSAVNIMFPLVAQKGSWIQRILDKSKGEIRKQNLNMRLANGTCLKLWIQRHIIDFFFPGHLFELAGLLTPFSHFLSLASQEKYMINHKSIQF